MVIRPDLRCQLMRRAAEPSGFRPDGGMSMVSMLQSFSLWTASRGISDTSGCHGTRDSPFPSLELTTFNSVLPDISLALHW
jgi:hypothetical protein